MASTLLNLLNTTSQRNHLTLFLTLEFFLELPYSAVTTGNLRDLKNRDTTSDLWNIVNVKTDCESFKMLASGLLLTLSSAMIHGPKEGSFNSIVGVFVD